MKCVVIPVLIILSVTSTAVCVQPTNCPGEDWPSGLLSLLVDSYGQPNAFALADSNYSYFREIMGFNEEEIEEDEQAALEFFNVTYGLDFFDRPEDADGNRFLPGAIFRRYKTDPDLNYRAIFNRWLLSGNTRSTCFDNRDGGFLVFFFEQRLVHGTYGGSEGVTVLPTEVVMWGYWNILVCPQQPLVIHFTSAHPSRAAADGYAAISLDLHQRTLGPGLAQAVMRILPTDDPNVFYYSGRVTCTFPPHPPGVEIP